MLIIYIARYSYRSSVPIRNVIRSVYSYIGPKIFLCNKDNKCQRKYKLGRKGLLRLAVVGCDYCTASVITLVHSNQGNYFKNAENEWWNSMWQLNSKCPRNLKKWLLKWKERAQSFVMVNVSVTVTVVTDPGWHASGMELCNSSSKVVTSFWAFEKDSNWFSWGGRVCSMGSTLLGWIAARFAL